MRHLVARNRGQSLSHSLLNLSVFACDGSAGTNPAQHRPAGDGEREADKMKPRRPRVRATIVFLASLVLLSGCAENTSQEETRTPMTERQRDSTIAASKLPGAKAVGKALELADSAAARAARALPEEP